MRPSTRALSASEFLGADQVDSSLQELTVYALVHRHVVHPDSSRGKHGLGGV